MVNSEQRFAEMCRLEPRLRDLADVFIDLYKKYDGKTFCAVVAWEGLGLPEDRSFKAKVAKLAGYQAAHPELRNRESHDVAVKELKNLLPPCNDCACTRAS